MKHISESIIGKKKGLGLNLIFRSGAFIRIARTEPGNRHESDFITIRKDDCHFPDLYKYYDKNDCDAIMIQPGPGGQISYIPCQDFKFTYPNIYQKSKYLRIIETSILPNLNVRNITNLEKLEEVFDKYNLNV